MIPAATLRPSELTFRATVTAILPEGAIISETLFYPTSGGQPCDTGIIERGGVRYTVTEVRKHDRGVLHVLDRTGLSPGDEVAGLVNGQRRTIHRRMHTAMHVLCAVLERAAGTRITGNQIGGERSRLDVDLPEYDPVEIRRAVGAANAIIAQALPVARRVVSREEFLADPSLVKLAAGFPENVHEVHLVEIPGVDTRACGGTHVDRLGEIDRIVLLKTENRGKSNRRIYFGLAR